MILLAQVPLLGAGDRRAVQERGLRGGQRDADDAVTVLFLVVTMVVWFGSIDGAREIIKEKSVYVREAAVGVRTGAYLLSKARGAVHAGDDPDPACSRRSCFVFQPLHSADVDVRDDRGRCSS